MTTGKALDGKPYAGNPHVRFDEGEVASCTAEGSLLYRTVIKTLNAGTARRSVLFAVAVVSVVSTFATVVVPKGEVLPNNSTINEDTVVEELNLASNMAYTVISTATLTIKNVTGGAFRFTAQGYGTVVFEKIDNTEMELNVLSTAHVKFRAVERPAACDNAFFHVDASDETTMSFSSFNGTNFVTRWNDVRGDGRPYAEKNSNANCKGYPFTVNGYLNGRPVVDFGTLWQSGGLRGVGASQVWSEACARPVEVFAVIGDTEDSSANVSGIGGQQYRNNSWYGCTNSTTGYRGNGDVGTTCEILHANALINSRARAAFTVDGEAVTATSFRPSADSMHLVSWYATDSAYINGTGSADAPMNAFASERNGELGGIRIAEYIVFTNAVLSAADRTEVSSYLIRKWSTADSCDFTLASLRLAASDTSSAELILSGGAKVSVGTFLNEGSVTGNGTVVAAREERSAISLSGNRTIDVPDGSTNIVNRLDDTGYMLVKKGGGTLVINAADAAKVRVSVEDGTLEFKAVPDEAPAALAKAWFHVDAGVASSLTVSAGDGGTNYVTKWADVRGEGHPYAERTIGKHDPFISGTALNGLPVVDFGTTWNRGKTDGYGAALQWSEAIERPMEIFIVEQHNSDMESAIINATGEESDKTRVRNQTLLGSTGTSYPLLTGNPDGSNSVSVIGTSATLAGNSYAAQLTVDLESKGAARTAAYHPGYGFHVYGIYMSGSTYLSDTSYKATIDAFACERGNIYGGQRIAECIVYSNLLTAAEREAVNTYLYNKWKNEIAVGELEVKSGASVSVPDGSTVRVRILHGEMPAVSGGRLEADLQVGTSLVASSSVTYDPLASADAWFHVDANAADSLVSEVREDGTNYVTRWSDVRGAGIYAEQTIGKNGHDPYMADGALNGLPAVDFGTTWNTAKTDGYGAALKWSETLERTMEIFVIEQHNGDMASTISGSSSTGPTVRNQSIIGVNGAGYTSNAPFLPGNPDGENDSVSVIGAGAMVSSDNYVGRLSVDLQDKGNAKTSNYHPGYDFHLYNVYVTGSKYLSDVDAALALPLNAFACERGNIYGGQRIAECLVFDRVLSADERTFYGNLLYAKWFAGAGAPVEYANATVPAGVTLGMPYQALTLSGNLEIGGCLKATSVAPAAITVTGLGASVDGRLDLGTSGGVITLPGTEWDSLAYGEYRLIGASSVSGSIANWTVTMPDCPKKVAGSPVARDDGIYVSISRRTTGIRIIIK